MVDFAPTEEKISLGPEDQNTGEAPISLDPTAPEVSDSAAERRSNEAHVALGKDSPGLDAIRLSIRNGSERDIRLNAATLADMEAEKQRLSIVQEEAQKGAPDPDRLLTIAQHGLVRRNPDTILEFKLADAVVNQVSSLLGGASKVVLGAFGMDSDNSLDATDATRDAIVKNRLVQNRVEEAEDALKRQSGGSRALDLLEGFVPGVNWLRLSRAAKDLPIGVDFPGATMESTVRSLYALPPDRFKEEFDKVFDYLKQRSPADAAKFAHAMQSYSKSDAAFDSAMEALNWIGIPGVNEAGKVVKGVAGQVLRREVAGAGAKAADNALKSSTSLSSGTLDGVFTTPEFTAQRDKLRSLKSEREASLKAIDSLLVELNDLARKAFPGKESFEDIRRGLKADEFERIRKGLTPSEGLFDDIQKGLKNDEFNRIKDGLKSDEQRRAQELLAKKWEEHDAIGRKLEKLDKQIESQSVVVGLVKDRAVRTVNEFQNVMRAVFRGATADSTIDVGRAFSIAGDTEKAAAANAARSATQAFKDIDPAMNRGWMMSHIPSIFNPNALSDGSALARELTERVVERLRAGGNTLLNALDDAKVSRLTPEAEQVGILEALERAKSDYSHVRHALLDMEHTVVPAEKNASNTTEVSIYLGKTDGTLFKDGAEAAKFGELYGMLPSDIQPVQQGAGWTLKVTRPVDETSDGVRAAMVATKRNQTPQGFFNQVFTGFLRSAEDLISPFQSEQRHIAQHAHQKMVKAVQEVAQNIQDLSNAEKVDLKRILEDHKSYFNEDEFGNKTIGRFARNVDELIEDYRRITGKVPNEKEITAYFSYVQLNDFDWLNRNFTIYRDKVRQGIQRYALRVHNDQGEIMTAKAWDGKQVKELPKNIDTDAGVYIHWNSSFENEGQFVRLKSLDADTRKTIDDLLAEGSYKIIQVANPMERPLRSIAQTERPVHFVITKNLEVGRQSWQQIPYRPGGHKEYNVKFFVKQPKVVRMEEGDISSEPSITTRSFKTSQGRDTNVFVSNNRIVTVVDIDGVPQPFYISTGSGGKKSVETGKWYPYFGNGPNDGWFNKGSEDQIRNHYGNAKLKKAAEHLDRTIGDIRAKKDDLPREKTRNVAPDSWLNDNSVDTAGLYDHLKPVDHKDSAKGGQFISDHLSRLEAAGTRQKSLSHSYEGDISIFGFHTEAEARKYAEHMDTARKLLKENRSKELQDYLEKHLPYSETSFRGLFRAAEDGKPARLNIDDPIVYLSDGRRYTDDYNPSPEWSNFEDNIRNPYNLYGSIDKEYAGERNPDLHTVREGAGTQQDPLYKLGLAEQLDPYATMTRSMANVMRNRYMADYKIQAVESFIEEFGDLLRGTRSMEELRANAMFDIHNPQWDTSTPDKYRLDAAKNARLALVNFLGTESPGQAFVTTQLEKLGNELYERMGQKVSDFAATKLPAEVDPFRFMRKVAFHAKLGLFNPVQLFLQSQTLAHVLAVAGPITGVKAMGATGLMNAARFTANPQVLEGIAAKAVAFGWKKDDFLESLTLLRKTGYDIVEGEVSWADDMLDPKIFEGSGTKFLDKGTWFFREAEKQVRMSAWNAAYLEWKQASKGAAPSIRDTQQILRRADLMAANMTRASNARWNQGIWSVPTQFMSYQARLMEQFLGGRLTMAEKGRAFLTYSALYGVPVGGLGAAFGVYPWFEDIRQAALERGMDMNDTSMRVFMEGIPQTVLHALTGSDINLAERVGPGGIKFFKELLIEGKAEVLLGPSASITGQVMRDMAPAYWAAASPFREDESASFKLTPNDFIQAAQNISTVNQAVRTYWAYNLGIWTTKSGQVIEDGITPFDAILSGITGANPRSVTDAQLMMSSIKDTEKAQKEAQKLIENAYERAFKAAAEGDDQGFQDYMKRVKLFLIMGGFRPDQYGKVFSQSMKPNVPLADRVKADFWKKAPNGQQKPRIDQFLGNN